MSYPPNVIAACRLAEIVARVRARGHEVRLLIIGRDPDARVRALASDSVEVTGTVPNVWTWIERVDLFAFPMTTGAGLQNKLLEAMYAKRVVICTDVCNGGIQGRSEEHLLLAETDEDFVAAIERLISSPETAREIAERGHALVQRAFDWDSILPGIATLWASVPETVHGARILPRPYGRPGA
jgi:glycosyltransferase involved in cell wall biosynthesis